jgi:hypothetical protein
MKSSQLWLNHATACQAERENAQQQPERQSLQGFAHVNPLGAKMQQRQNTTNQMKIEITRDDDLRRFTRISAAQLEVGAPKEAEHWFGKKGRRDAEGEEDGCPKPHRRIGHAHKSQKPNHLFRVKKSRCGAKFSLRSADAFGSRDIEGGGRWLGNAQTDGDRLRFLGAGGSPGVWTARASIGSRLGPPTTVYSIHE